MCYSCVVAMPTEPLKLWIIWTSLALAAVFLLLVLLFRSRLSRLRKLLLIYGHIFFLIFPLIFLVYGNTCSNMSLSCDAARSIMYTMPIAFVITLLGSFVVVPFIYRFSLKCSAIKKNNPIYRNVMRFVKEHRIKMPRLYLIDQAEPVAFSFNSVSPRIFLSVGLVEILNRKELEAVILHELGHIKQKSSFLKFTNTITKLFSPISSFIVHEEMNMEEEGIDRSVAQKQNTDSYLKSAKRKINRFYKSGLFLGILFFSIVFRYF